MKPVCVIHVILFACLRVHPIFTFTTWGIRDDGACMKAG